MKAMKLAVTLLLVGAMLVSLFLPVFAHTAMNTTQVPKEVREQKAVPTIDPAYTNPYCDGLYLDFDSEEDLSNWSGTSMYPCEDLLSDSYYDYYDADISVNDKGLYVGIGGVAASLSFCPDVDYYVRPEDQLEIDMSIDWHNPSDVSVFVATDEEFETYDLGYTFSGGVLNTGPLGISGNLKSVTFSFDVGYSYFADSITVKYLYVGRNYFDDAGIEIVFADPMGNRLTGGEVTFSGERTEGFIAERDSFRESADGTYRELKDGSYTDVSPDSLINGVPVNPDDYLDPSVTYEKETKSEYVIPEGETNSVTSVVGDDGIVRFKGMREGTYRISALRSPEGYVSPEDDIIVTIRWDGENYVYSYEGALCENGIGRVVIINSVVEPGEITDKGVKLNHSLNLTNDISVNYLISASQLGGYDMETLYLSVDIPCYEDNVYTGSVTEKLYPQYRGEYCYFVLDGLTAIQMNDMLTAQLHGNKWGFTYSSVEDSYSIATYAMSQLNKAEARGALKTLCANLLRYGAKAQEFKGYRTDALADEAMTQQHCSYLTELKTVVFANNYLELNDEYETGFAWTGRGLNLGSRVGVTLRMEKLDETLADGEWSVVVRYRNLAGELITYTVDPSGITKDGNMYSFEFAGLAATELRTVIAVTVCDAEGKPISKTLVYSPDTYGNGKTELLGDICRALFAYSDSAKAFFVG